MKPLLSIALMLFLLLPAYAQQDRIEVINLRNRFAEDLIPLLQPVVGSQGVVTGRNNQLIVRATPDKIAQIRELLGQLDTAPRNLLISVRQAGTDEGSRTGLGASGSVGVGEQGRVIIGGNPRGGVDVRAEQGNTHRNDNVIQQIQVLDGSEAYIQTGQEIPRTERYITQYGGIRQEYRSNYYQPVTTGFYVRPRLSGDQVTLEIAPQRQRESLGGRGVIETQNLSTMVSGRLGQWLELGGVNQSSQSQSSGLLLYGQSQEQQNRRIQIKVEVMP